MHTCRINYMLSCSDVTRCFQGGGGGGGGGLIKQRGAMGGGGSDSD